MQYLHHLILSLILFSSHLHADEKQQCEEALFTTRNPLEFEAALKKASELKLNKQIVLEATFLYYVDTENYKAIASLHTQFQNESDQFDLGSSKIFSTKEQWQSVIEYSLALESLNKGDEIQFKKHITEAFWLSPKTSSAFSHHITTLRNKQALAKITIAPDRELLNLTDLKPTTFKKVIKDNEALILRFWSPWNQQIDATYPHTENAANQSHKNNVAFASILLGDDNTLLTSAQEIIIDHTPALPSQWLVDSNKHSLARELRITELPTLVIISKEGKILYHGSSSNNLFWNTLTSINANFIKSNSNKLE